MGPVKNAGEFDQALQQAIEQVRSGQAVVLDVHVMTGYAPAMSQGMTRDYRN
jgi:N-formylglutamate amidohydrolase